MVHDDFFADATACVYNIQVNGSNKFNKKIKKMEKKRNVSKTKVQSEKGKNKYHQFNLMKLHHCPKIVSKKRSIIVPTGFAI